ncbi:MAG TPA: hypothetical protein PKE64_07380 [Anaerolineae bacterium]|nr:hypothetical protein [Anaerolineae bacterium]HMR63820.1 hypothetical protein [Anaerolineae bacterium]
MNSDSMVAARRRKRRWKKIKSWLMAGLVMLMISSMLMVDLSYIFS